MESASDHWRVWFVVLEAAGLAVQLLELFAGQEPAWSAETGKVGAACIARLTEMGLLRASFVPPPQIRAPRQCTGQLVHLTQDRTRYWQRLEKLPESALCKLTSVVSGPGHAFAAASAALAVAAESFQGAGYLGGQVAAGTGRRGDA